MADSLMLPIRPQDITDSDTSNLSSKLQQVEAQRGPFRHLFERTLRDEVQNSRSQNEVEIPDEDEKQEESVESQQERLWKGREEMLRQLERAQNETFHALDFISFLLSKHSVSAQSSMSPVLKQAAPVGTIDGRVIKTVEPSIALRRRLDSVSRGDKVQSFQTAAQKIQDASMRLEAEAGRESSFWDGVAHIQHLGWAVSRLPRDNRIIGVHFGFAEAAPRFRNRGFAILRRSEEGKLMLDEEQDNSRNSAVQATIIRKGNRTGSSSVSKIVLSKDAPIEERLLQIRNGLFEEELFFEASREGRTIANQGVSISAKTIRFKVDEEVQVEIEVVDSDSLNLSMEPENDQELAESVMIALRLLLSKAHTQNLAQRSTLPLPLPVQPRTIPDYALLRPLMSHLRHRSVTSSLNRFLDEVSQPLKNAGLQFSISLKTASGDPNSALSLVTSDDIFRYLLAPAETVFNLILPSSQKFSLSVRTLVGPPAYGTEFTTSNLTYAFTTAKQPRLTRVADVEDFVCHALVMDVVAIIESMNSTTPTGPLPNLKPSEERLTWAILNAHGGELALRTSNNTISLLSVHVRKDRLGLRHLMRQSKNGGSKDMTWLWSGQKMLRTPPPTKDESTPQNLENIIKDLMLNPGLDGS